MSSLPRGLHARGKAVAQMEKRHDGAGGEDGARAGVRGAPPHAAMLLPAKAHCPAHPARRKFAHRPDTPSNTARWKAS